MPGVPAAPRSRPCGRAGQVARKARPHGVQNAVQQRKETLLLGRLHVELDQIGNAHRGTPFFRFDQGRPCLGIGRVEAFERQFGERDAGGGAENGRGRDEAQHPLASRHPQFERHGEQRMGVSVRGGRSRRRGTRVGGKLCVQFSEEGIARALHLHPQSLQYMVAPLAEVGDARCEPLWMEARPQHVERWRQHGRVHSVEQRHRCNVCLDERPLRVDGNRGEGHVAGKDRLHCLADLRKLRRV